MAFLEKHETMTQKSKSGAPSAEVGAYLGVGLQFALTIALSAYGGWWVDARWGTSPWLLIGGCLLGSVGGFYHLYRTLVGEAPKTEKETGEETS